MKLFRTQIGDDTNDIISSGANHYPEDDRNRFEPFYFHINELILLVSTKKSFHIRTAIEFRSGFYFFRVHIHQRSGQFF